MTTSAFSVTIFVGEIFRICYSTGDRGMAGSSWIYQTERVYLCLMMFPYWHSLYEITTLGFDFLCVWPAVVHPQGVRSGSSLALNVRRAAGTSADWRTGRAGRREQALAWFVLWRGLFCGVEPSDWWAWRASPAPRRLSPRPALARAVSTFALLLSHRLGSGHWLWSTWAVLFTCPLYLSSYLVEGVGKIPYLPSPQNKYILREHNQVKQGGVYL